MSQTELVCARCAPVEARVAELEAALRSISAEHEDTAEELAGARSTTRTLERQLRALKAELTKHHESSPDAQKITSYLETWVRISGAKNPKRVNIGLDSDRAKLVRTMSRRYSWPELQEALQGAALVPYMAFGRRSAKTEKGAKLSLDLDYIIGKNKYVEENRDNYRRAQAGDADRFWEGYQNRHAQSLAYADVMLDKLMRRDNPDLVVLLDDLEQETTAMPELRAPA